MSQLRTALCLLVLLAAGVAVAQPAQTGQIVVASAPPGASVTVDGTPRGVAPVTIKDLLPGQHLVEAWWVDGASVSTVVDVQPSRSRLVTMRPAMRLRDAAAPAPAPAAAESAEPGAAPVAETGRAAGDQGGLAGGPPAGAWSTEGGQLLEPHGKNITVEAGLPQIRADFHLGIVDRLEIAPFVSFFFLDTLAPWPGATVGDQFGAKFKVKILDTQNVAFAFIAEPALLFLYVPQFCFALQLGAPEFAVTWRLRDTINLNFAFLVPLRFFAVPDFAVQIPILAGFKPEFRINDRIHVFGSFEIGPEITVIPSLTTTVGMYLQLLGGVGFKI